MIESGVEPDVRMTVALPRPRLRPLVARYLGYRMTGLPPGVVHRGLPSRHLTLVVTIEGNLDLIGGVAEPVSLPAVAGGLSARPVLIGMGDQQYGIQADLTPLGARALFGLPAGELADLAVDLGDLLGPPAGELLDRLRSARTWADRFAHLDAVLERVAADEAGMPAELDRAWRRLAHTGGAVGVGDLADEVGWTRQHLGDLFRREFGLAPKVAARVMRFETARNLLVAPHRPGLAEVAVRCGYYDQAHLNRDWREFTGVSPSDWIAEELPYVQDRPADGE